MSTAVCLSLSPSLGAAPLHPGCHLLTYHHCRQMRGGTGITEASITRNPSTPITRHSGSTTACASPLAPIRHVPTACTHGIHSVHTHWTSCASSRKSSIPWAVLPSAPSSAPPKLDFPPTPPSSPIPHIPESYA